MVMKNYNVIESSIIDIPEPTGEAVIVKIAGAGVCHSDLHLLKGQIPNLPYPLPIVLGHENSGVVYKIGDKVPSKLLNKPVLIYGGWYEEEDEYSLSGDQQLSDKATWPGIIKYNGGYAEYMYVPHYRFLVSAEGLEDLEASSILTDAGLTPYRAVKKLLGLIKPDDYIAVIGLGGLGLFGVQYVKQLLNARVIAIDIYDEKIEFASKIVKFESSDILINVSKINPRDEVRRATGSKGVKAVIDFVASEKTISTYLDLVGKKGFYIIVGLHSMFGPPIPVTDLVIKEAGIIGSLWGNIMELYEVVELAKRGLIKYRELVEKIKLDELKLAFEKLEKGVVRGRQVAVPY